ncbi:hypothetical protein LJC71_08080 [Desulfosarcina sp. OttesenSCG-928-A07]|nr:hypothetical protein [Desulfosarcina sp. OttesenSCG-928-A07]
MIFFHQHKTHFFAFLLIFVLTGLTLSCTWKKKQGLPPIEIPKTAAPMTVQFSWADIAACTHESPEIQVSGIPAGTVELDVQLRNLTVPAWSHGGGRVLYDGTDRILAGTLNVGYNGPCPMPGERNKYAFFVMALNLKGEIIGFGKAVQAFPIK